MRTSGPEGCRWRVWRQPGLAVSCPRAPAETRLQRGARGVGPDKLSPRTNRRRGHFVGAYCTQWPRYGRGPHALQARGGMAYVAGTSSAGGGGGQMKEQRQVGSVCLNCRRLKRRCDRQFPCGSCVKLREKDPTACCVYAPGDAPVPPNLVPDDDVRTPPAAMKRACAACRKRKKRCVHNGGGDRGDDGAAHAPAKFHPGAKAGGEGKSSKTSHVGAASHPVRTERSRPKAKQPSVPAVVVRKVSAVSSVYRRVISCAECRRKKQRCLCGPNGELAAAQAYANQKIVLSSGGGLRVSSAVKHACAHCRQRKKRCTHLYSGEVGQSNVGPKGGLGVLFNSPIQKPARMGGNLSAKERKRERDRQRKRRSASAAAVERVGSPASSSQGKKASAGVQGNASGGAIRMRGVNGSTLVRWAACDKCRKRRIRCLHMKAVLVNGGGSVPVKEEDSGGAKSAGAAMTIMQMFKSAKRPLPTSGGAADSLGPQRKKRKSEHARPAGSGSKPLAGGAKAKKPSAPGAPASKKGKEAADVARFVPCLECKRKKRKCWCNVKKGSAGSDGGVVSTTRMPASSSKGLQTGSGLRRVKVEGSASTMKRQKSGGAGGMGAISHIFTSVKEQEEVNWLLEFAQLAKVSVFALLPGSVWVMCWHGYSGLTVVLMPMHAVNRMLRLCVLQRSPPCVAACAGAC